MIRNGRIPDPARVVAGALFLALLGVGAGAPADARSASERRPTEDFSWSWRIPAGKSIEIKGVNGGIHAVASDGDQVEVTARKHARRSDPASVRVEFVEHEAGVTVCAVYPGRGERRDACAPGGGSHAHVRDNDVVVDFEVRVPRGVRLVAHTVNGGIDAHDLRSAITAESVNGSIEVSTDDLAEASTVNGSIEASMGRARWDDALRFSTVNGAIALSFPARLSARVQAATVNGDIASDFDLRVRGRIGRRTLAGTVGDGGPGELQLSTVNGNIRLAASE